MEVKANVLLPDSLVAFFFFFFLKKFSDKFKEVKDAARLAREKSQDKELANTALTIAAPQVSWTLDKEHVTLKVEQTLQASGRTSKCLS